MHGLERKMLTKAQVAETSLPLYSRVKQHILERVERGEWPQGTKLPSEHALVAALGVSRMTVNRALRELSAEGVVYRMQGLGSFVAAPPPVTELVEIRDIAEDIVLRGHRHRAAVMLLEASKASLDLANTFNVRPGAKIFHSVVVHFENDLPIQIEDRYVNPSFAPDYLGQDFSTQTTTHYLRDIRPATELEHTVFAIAADEQTAQLLTIDLHDPCLLLQRRTWIGSTPATKTLFTCPGSRFSLSTRQKLF